MANLLHFSNEYIPENNGDWNNPDNWWDAGAAEPAGRLPEAGDTLQIWREVSNPPNSETPVFAAVNFQTYGGSVSIYMGGIRLNAQDIAFNGSGADVLTVDSGIFAATAHISVTGNVSVANTRFESPDTWAGTSSLIAGSNELTFIGNTTIHEGVAELGGIYFEGSLEITGRTASTIFALSPESSLTLVNSSAGVGGNLGTLILRTNSFVYYADVVGIIQVESGSRIGYDAVWQSFMASYVGLLTTGTGDARDATFHFPPRGNAAFFIKDFVLPIDHGAEITGCPRVIGGDVKPTHLTTRPGSGIGGAPITAF